MTRAPDLEAALRCAAASFFERSAFPVSANRDTWTVTRLGDDGSLTVAGRPGQRTLPSRYVHHHVELAYATTVYGAQGDTVDVAHLVVGETTGAAATYVGMTRGRHQNLAHLVADSDEDARTHWAGVFGRDRADLGPAHAAKVAAQDVDRYGTLPTSGLALQAAALRRQLFNPEPEESPESYSTSQPGHGIER